MTVDIFGIYKNYMVEFLQGCYFFFVGWASQVVDWGN
jgi:hypothetical protein